MKVKFKITVDQFHYLVYYINGSTYEGLNDLQVLNIRLFITTGLKKLIDLKSLMMFSPNKLKPFSIEVNQYSSLMALLTHQRNYLDPYTMAIYITLQSQTKSILNLSQ